MFGLVLVLKQTIVCMSLSIYFNDHIYYHIIHIWTSRKGLRVAIYVHYVDCQSQSIWLSISVDLIVNLRWFDSWSQSIQLSISVNFIVNHGRMDIRTYGQTTTVDLSQFDCWSQSIRLLISVDLIVDLSRFHCWSQSIWLFISIDSIIHINRFNCQSLWCFQVLITDVQTNVWTSGQH